ncbi:hypothetical protein WJX73_004257 [Symbiochloris irregularis]|uniref:Cyanobacterial aminoacyl-tRNA synthetase CAAD domain-containing protein n=1 Tax=Symbiochloris irregularis TaxID=706552 RepID=A0AAW1NNV4_9CHLO
MALLQVGSSRLFKCNSSQPRLTAFKPSSAVSGRTRVVQVAATRNFNFKTRDTEREVKSEADAASTDFQNKAEEYLNSIQRRWDKVEEKPVAIAIGVTALVVIWAASGLVDRIDRLPLVGGLLELVGLLVTGWFVYRYLVFGPDRDELKQNLDKFLSKADGISS